MLVPLGPETDRRANAALRSFTDEPWCIVNTSTRHEKIVASQFRARGIPCLLPLIEAERDYCGTTCRVELPMFPGYVFARGSIDALLGAAGAGSVRHVRIASDQELFAWQARSLELALDLGAALEMCTRSASQQRAEVRSGKLNGLQGIVENFDAPPKLIFEIDGFPQAYCTGILGASVVSLNV